MFAGCSAKFTPAELLLAIVLYWDHSSLVPLPWWLTSICHTPCCYETEAEIVSNLLLKEKRSNELEAVLGKRLDHRRLPELEIPISPQFQKQFIFMAAKVIGAVRTVISICMIKAHEHLHSSGTDEKDLGEGISPSHFAIRVLWVSVLYFFLLGWRKSTSPFLVSLTVPENIIEFTVFSILTCTLIECAVYIFNMPLT